MALHPQIPQETVIQGELGKIPPAKPLIFVSWRPMSTWFMKQPLGVDAPSIAQSTLCALGHFLSAVNF